MTNPICLKIPLNGSTIIEVYFKHEINLESLSQKEIEIISQVIETLMVNSIIEE
jgi:hypothetical protein